MDRYETRPMLLARIPDVSVADPQQTREKWPQPRSRVFGQAISFKLLAGAAVLMVVIAVAPFVLYSGGQPAAPSTAAAPLPAWEPTPSGSSETAPREPTLVAAAPAGTPAPTSSMPTSVGVAVVPTHAEVRGGIATAAATLAKQDSTGSTAVPALARREPTATTAAPQMSQWPNPAYPISSSEAGREEPRPIANQSTSIR